MSDTQAGLREQLASIIEDAVAGFFPLGESTDAAIAAVQQWLRDEADEPPKSQLTRETLHRLADDLGESR